MRYPALVALVLSLPYLCDMAVDLQFAKPVEHGYSQTDVAAMNRLVARATANPAKHPITEREKAEAIVELYGKDSADAVR
jgi:hypothetical protein